MAKYHVQIKLLKLLNDSGVYPNVFDIIMDWVQEYFIIKETFVPAQKSMKRDAIMKTINGCNNNGLPKIPYSKQALLNNKYT